MKVSCLSFGIFLAVCILLLSSFTDARQWRPADPRCGNSAGSYRLRRSAVTNNRKNSDNGFGLYHYTYNGNSGSCERQYGSSSDYSAFDSKGECDRVCRNVYHFSK